MEFVVSFEKQVSNQRDDLAKATVDLQAASVHRVSLEQQIQQLTNTFADHKSMVLLNSATASSSSLQTRFDEMEGIAVELSHRAESAENSLKMLMSIKTTISDAPPSEEHKVEREGDQSDQDSNCLNDQLLEKIDSDFDKISSEHLQHTRKIQQEDCAAHQTCHGTQFSGPKIPWDSGKVEDHEDFVQYDIIRNQVLEEFYDAAAGIHPFTTIDGGKNPKFLCSSSSTPKSIIKKSKVKSVPSKALGNPMTKARRKHSESSESDNSRVSAILKTADFLQNLSLGSDNGHTSLKRMKDVHRKCVTKRNQSSCSGSDGIISSRSIPLDNCRQNGSHSRMKECIMKGSSSRSDDIIKAPSQTRKIISKKVLDGKGSSVSRYMKWTATDIFYPSSSLIASHQLAIGGGCRATAKPPLLLKSAFPARPKPSTEKAMGGRSRLQVSQLRLSTLL